MPRRGRRPSIPAGIDSAPTEAIVVLVVVDLVVGLFVGLQIAYLFGGQSTLVAAGMTYSDYARRGFFELVAAACLAGGVVVALETTVARRSRPYLAALLGAHRPDRGRARLGGASAPPLPGCLRLDRAPAVRPDDDRRARGAALVVMAALALAGRMRWLGHGLAVIGVVALVALNLVAPAGFVAARNVERVIDPSLVPPGGHAGLDAAYLGVLPDDAVPVLVAALPALPETRTAGRPRASSTSARPSSRPIRRSPARPPGTSDANGARAPWRPCRDLTAAPAAGRRAVSLGDGTPLRTAVEPMLAKAADASADRRRLAVRAEVGRLPGARLP